MVDYSGIEPDAGSLGGTSDNLYSPHSFMNKQPKPKVPDNKPKPVPDKPNPQHKKDFDRLLDMAIAPPKKPHI